MLKIFIVIGFIIIGISAYNLPLSFGIRSINQITYKNIIASIVLGISSIIELILLIVYSMNE